MPWANFAVALGIGLLVGLERERSKGEGPSRRIAGIRTFAIAALLGAIATLMGGVILLAAVVLGLGIAAALERRAIPQTDPGITTEAALVGVMLLGGLAMSQMALAAGLGAIIAVLLAAKAPVHRFAKSILTDGEISDGLTLAIAALTVWPLLPDRLMGPLNAINPHTLGLVVIIVMAIGAAGHAATRMLGERWGLPLSGLVAGFVSSTATIGAMGAKAVANEQARLGAVAGAALSVIATYVQMGVLLLAISPPTFEAMTPAILAGSIAAAMYGAVFTVMALRSPVAAAAVPGRAFGLMAALGLAGLLAAIFVTSAALQKAFGEAGAVASALVAGFVDAHAAALAIAERVSAGSLDPAGACVPILAGITANGIAKIAVAFGAGRSFGVRVAPGIVLSVAGCWAAWGLHAA